MKTFTLCFFGLLVLGVFAQVKGDFVKEESSTRQAISGVVSYAKGILIQRKANIIRKFSDQVTLLQSNNDACSLKRANKIDNLNEQFKDLDSCTIVDDLVTELETIITTVLTVIGEVLSAVVSLIVGVLTCLLNPGGSDCLEDQLELLVKTVLTVIGQVISVIVGIVVAIITLIVDLLKCLNLQQVFEDKFEVIMKTSCYEL